jgi:alcohol dehydrogenase class IV
MRAPEMTYLTDIYFHGGAVGLVAELLEKFGVRRPMVVTDRGIVQAGLLGQLKIAPSPTFDQVETNPTEASASQAIELYRAQGCDGLVAFGGGSPIDLAKIVALLAHHQGPLEQYAVTRGGLGRITSRMPPLIAVPTTAGSGSEVGRAALITLSGGPKLGFLSPHLLPKAAVCDPALTLSMSPKLTAGTGMDAISHCIEAFCSPRKNPVADAIALDGLARGWSNIEIAYANGADLQARSEMMLCSLQGGLSFQKGLGAVHSLSHPLGALSEKRLHHGTLNAVFLPIVLRFNADSCADKFDRMEKLLGLSGGELPEAIAQLNRRLGLPANLSEMGLTPADLEPLSAQAAADHCSPTNPRALGQEDCAALYRSALGIERASRRIQRVGLS